jgi:hypothetical protein
MLAIRAPARLASLGGKMRVSCKTDSIVDMVDHSSVLFWMLR